MEAVRLVFMGSPDFALPSFRALAAGYQLVGVVTQPDRPAGRGRVLTSPPVKSLAQELGVPVIQPRRLREPEAMEQLHAWNPDLIVVAAFGQILRSEVLYLPPFGCINVHASLLPRWRGAAPVQAAILHGDQTSGVTIMKMDPGVDTGPIISQRSLTLAPDETAGSLTERLAELGAALLIETLTAYLAGGLLPQPQIDDQATYAPLIKKEDGKLDFNMSAEELARRVRAFNPWPGASMSWQGNLLKIHRAHAARTDRRSSAGDHAAPGQRQIYHGLPAVITADGMLVLDEVQPAGKRPQPGKSFLQGARDWA